MPSPNKEEKATYGYEQFFINCLRSYRKLTFNTSGLPIDQTIRIFYVSSLLFWGCFGKLWCGNPSIFYCLLALKELQMNLAPYYQARHSYKQITSSVCVTFADSSFVKKILPSSNVLSKQSKCKYESFLLRIQIIWNHNF